MTIEEDVALRGRIRELEAEGGKAVSVVAELLARILVLEKLLAEAGQAIRVARSLIVCVADPETELLGGLKWLDLPAVRRALEDKP